MQSKAETVMLNLTAHIASMTARGNCFLRTPLEVPGLRHLEARHRLKVRVHRVSMHMHTHTHMHMHKHMRMQMHMHMLNMHMHMHMRMHILN